MLHKAWSSIEEVPYCFWRSSVKFQGHTALKIIKFDPNWVFPDCNSSLNSPMAMKCCTKLETAKERCPIVFQGHPSNFKVTRYKTSPILTQIGHFPTVGRSQLSNPSDLPCWRSSVKFQGHTALKIIKFDPNWVFPDCNSSLNSPMAMKCCTKLETAKERCPIVFQGHPSNFKVTRYKTSPILTQIGHFPTVGRSQLSNPSDLPCFLKGLIDNMSLLVQVMVWCHVGDQPLTEPMMTKFCDACHMTPLSQSELTHCGLMTLYGDRDLCHVGSVNGLLPDGAKPLPEPMFTHHQSGSATSVWSLHWKTSREIIFHSLIL